jgi:hypothetical protein
VEKMREKFVLSRDDWKMSSLSYLDRLGRSQMAGQSQSPSGSLALTSTFPYMKVNPRDDLMKWSDEARFSTFFLSITGTGTVNRLIKESSNSNHVTINKWWASLHDVITALQIGRYQFCLKQ